MDILLIWFLIFVIALILEMITVQFISLPFVVGSLVAIICAYLRMEIQYQILVFAIVSFLSLFLFQFFIRKKLKVKQIKTNVDALINQIGFVEEDFDQNTKVGRIDINGVDWRAVSSKVLKKGMKVKVKKIEGATLVVEEDE